MILKEYGVRYFVYTRLVGNYSNTNLSDIWGDIFESISRQSPFFYYEAEVEHITILHHTSNKIFIDVGFILLDDIRPTKKIKVKEIRGGIYAIIKCEGEYKEPCVNHLNYNTIYYRKHLNIIDEVQKEFLLSEIYLNIK